MILTTSTQKNRVLASDIIATAVVCFGVSRRDLLGHCRLKQFVLPRHAAMAVACEITGRSLPQLGALFGGRDHTTILHARDKAKTNRELQEAMAKLMAALTASPEGGGNG